MAASLFALCVLLQTPAPSPAAAPPPQPEGQFSVEKAAEAADLLQRALGFRIKPIGFLATHTVLNTGSALPTAEAPFFARAGTRPFYTLGFSDSGAPFDVQRGNPWKGAGSFLITPRQSRFGAELFLKLHPWVSARTVLEFDLWALYLPNIPPGINSGALRLRLAFVELGNQYLTLLAGQDLAPVSARYPLSTAHLAVAAFTQAGFIWNRVPQIALTGALPLRLAFPGADNHALFATAAIVRPHSGDETSAAITPFDVPEAGAASLLPMLQGRAGLRGKFLNAAVAALAGAENHTLTDAKGNAVGRRFVDSWMVGADGRVGSDAVWVQGQAWVGSNLNGMFAMTGVRRYPHMDAAGVPIAGTLRSVHSLRAVGGWAQASAPIWAGKIAWVAGMGMENALDTDNVAFGERTTNVAFQELITFRVHKHVDFGLEAYHVVSHYKLRSGVQWAWNDSLSAMIRVGL